MKNMTSHNITAMFLSLRILLGVARVLGELAFLLRQPAVLGELLTGVLLGDPPRANRTHEGVVGGGRNFSKRN
jgi:Kef-type K+ transport system membrane component KefB